MIAGEVEVKTNDGKVATGRVQNGNKGRWVGFSATWDDKRWTVSFTSGTNGICADRLALLGQKVAQSLGEPVLAEA